LTALARSWWLWVFLLAFGLRLGYLLATNEPPLFAHPYHYYRGAFLIAEDPHPWRFIWTSDQWRSWGGVWTLAPLYFLFMAGVLEVFGPHLFPVHVVQCVFEAGTAVLVGVLGRALAGRRGAWAGVAYALYWPAVELPSRLLTENVQTVLLVGAVATLARGAEEDAAGRVGRRWNIAGGLLLGISALARAVGFAFVPLVAAWRLVGTARRADGPAARRFRRGVQAAVIVTLSALAPVAPWWARNTLVMDDPSPIESVSVYNVWANFAFVNESRFAVQQMMINKETDPAGRRARAMQFAWRGITRRPEAFPEKVWTNFRHFLRPEGLHTLLTLEQARPRWGHWTAIVLEDLLLLAALPAFLAFVVAGRPSPTRTLVLLWTGYYLLMVIVVFHNEIRYRSAVVPFLFAGAAGGLASWVDPVRRRRARAAAGFALGAALAAWVLSGYLGPAFAAWRAARLLGPARDAVARGDLEAARASVLRAAAAAPGSAGPWLAYGEWLARARRPDESLAAFAEAGRLKPWLWVPRLVPPRLLEEAGRPAEVPAAVQQSNRLAWAADPWLALEAAWRVLPAPRTWQVRMGWDDHGAAQDFLHPHQDRYRWSRGRSRLRLQLPEAAPAYDLTLQMGSPLPSPLESPRVHVKVRGGAEAWFTLDRAVRPYTVRTPAPARGELLVEIESPTWSRSDSFADQGVRVDGMTVAPAR
jgi:hypothetical protein